MRISWQKETIDKVRADLIVVPFRSSGPNAAFEVLNKKSEGAFADLADTEKFKGEVGQITAWHGILNRRQVRYIAVGMGSGRIRPETWQGGIGKVVQYAARRGLGSVAVYVDDTELECALDQIHWTAQALLLATYRFRRYKTTPPPGTAPPKTGTLGMHPSVRSDAKFRDAIRRAKVAASGVIMARDLSNEPANILSPTEFAARARTLAKDRHLRCKVLDAAALRRLGMNLILAVGAGSARPPCLVHLTYTPPRKKRATVALVGKGVTFDSGGLCIKPPRSMFAMKTDMAGAGTVLGILSTLKSLALPVEVHGIIPLADNATGSDAMRPGDIITSLSGQTVEVLNTDGEGRLILADALTYANQFAPDVIVDYATLTGACAVALGPHIGGLFTPSDKLAKQYLAAADRTGEPFWRLPLSRTLKSELNSHIADIKNTPGRYGGAISAALFLKRFVAKTPWIHLDIAGPARVEKTTDLCPKGGSGFGVLAALEFLKILP
ncbi:MAG: leucyl aminopeptidase [Myxococcota bacterium]|nr:leucyl aminopeptidase [Myxococcota bacterium]